MRGHWGRLVLALLALFAVLRPALFVDDGSAPGPASDPASITRYDAEFTLARNGDLSVVETVVTAMPPGRHGIFRYWDVVDPADPHARLVPHDIAITRDGLRETVALSWEDHRRFRVAKIGDAAITLGSGAHTYVLRYRVDRALSDDGTRDARFRWNLVPGGWEMAIAEATVKTHVNRVLAKLGARTRVELVVLAYECGQVRAGEAARPV